MADDHQGLMIISTDYDYILMGMNVSLSCNANDSSGLVPTSPVLTCTEDRQWRPELSKIMCIKGRPAIIAIEQIVHKYI
jgi:hypothetical protein